jgi:hypothetical protein
MEEVRKRTDEARKDSERRAEEMRQRIDEHRQEDRERHELLLSAVGRLTDSLLLVASKFDRFDPGHH